MAPEVLSSQVLPASDLWSAGVMAHQLLTGRLPFDDHRNPFAPSISAVWKSVLVDKVAYNTPWWAGVSDDAKDFVASLLQRDPAKRPTAKEALKHPWLRGDSAERSLGKQIDVSVVQRIQRFAQASHFKRGVLQLIAEELLSQPGARAALAASASSQDLAAAGDTAAAAAQQQQQLERPPRGVIPGPDSGPLREIYRKLQFDSGASAIDRAQAAEALSKMGFTLMPSELAQLVDMMDTSRSGRVRRSAVAASQIDWRHMQQSDVDAWITIARRAFSSLDKDKDGGGWAGALGEARQARFLPGGLGSCPAWGPRGAGRAAAFGACPQSGGLKAAVEYLRLALPSTAAQTGCFPLPDTPSSASSPSYP
jgi:calcium-dependent protein kinase